MGKRALRRQGTLPRNPGYDALPGRSAGPGVRRAPRAAPPGPCFRMRTWRDLDGDGGSDILGQVLAQRSALAERLQDVRSIVAVTSGKGGVGKSTVTAGLARALARRGARGAVVDADLQGPSVPALLGLAGRRPGLFADGLRAPEDRHGIALLSSEQFLEDGEPLSFDGPAHDAFTWRRTEETTSLRQMLASARWGERDVLLLDLPPGSERLPDLADLLPRLDGALAVTLGSAVSLRVVRRAVSAARARGIRMLGLVESMSEQACGHCGGTTPLFGDGDDAARAASELELPLLARIPHDRALADGGDDAASHAGAATLAAFDTLAQSVMTLTAEKRAAADASAAQAHGDSAT